MNMKTTKLLAVLAVLAMAFSVVAFSEENDATEIEIDGQDSYTGELVSSETVAVAANGTLALTSGEGYKMLGKLHIYYSDGGSTDWTELDSDKYSAVYSSENTINTVTFIDTTADGKYLKITGGVISSTTAIVEIDEMTDFTNTSTGSAREYVTVVGTTVKLNPNKADVAFTISANLDVGSTYLVVPSDSTVIMEIQSEKTVSLSTKSSLDVSGTLKLIGGGKVSEKVRGIQLEAGSSFNATDVTFSANEMVANAISGSSTSTPTSIRMDNVSVSFTGSAINSVVRFDTGSGYLSFQMYGSQLLSSYAVQYGLVNANGNVCVKFIVGSEEDPCYLENLKTITNGSIPAGGAVYATLKGQLNSVATQDAPSIDGSTIEFVNTSFSDYTGFESFITRVGEGSTYTLTDQYDGSSIKNVEIFDTATVTLNNTTDLSLYGTFSSGVAITANAGLKLEENAEAVFDGGLTVAGNVTLAAGSSLQYDQQIITSEEGATFTFGDTIGLTAGTIKITPVDGGSGSTINTLTVAADCSVKIDGTITIENEITGDGSISVTKNGIFTATGGWEGSLSAAAGAVVTLGSVSWIEEEYSSGVFILEEGTISRTVNTDDGFDYVLSGTDAAASVYIADLLAAGDSFTVDEGATLTQAVDAFAIPAGAAVYVDGTFIPSADDTMSFSNLGVIEIGDDGTIGTEEDEKAGTDNLYFKNTTTKGKILNAEAGENLFVNANEVTPVADAELDIDADTTVNVTDESGMTIKSADVAANITLELAPDYLLTVSDAITLEDTGAILYIDGDGGVTATVEMGSYSVILTKAKGSFGIAYGSTELYGEIASGTVEIVSAEEAYLIGDLTIESGATLKIDSGVTLELRDMILTNAGSITGEGTLVVSDETYMDGSFLNTGSVASTVTVSYYDSGSTSIDVATGAAFVNAINSGLYKTINVTADIELNSDVLTDDLLISAKLINLGENTLTLNANVELIFKDAKLTTDFSDDLSSHGYIIVTQGVLVNNNSDIYSTVEIGEDGSVDNSKAKNQSSAGSSFSEDMKVGFGNTLTLSNYTVASNTTAEIYGTIIFDGSTKIADSGNVYVFGEAIIKGPTTVAGSMYILGTATLSSTMSITGVTTGNGALLYIMPTEANLIDLRTMDYDDEDWGFRITSEGTLTVTKVSSTSEVNNVLEIESAGFNVFRVDGTLNMNGLLTTDLDLGSDSNITNGGTINMNGEVDGDFIIGLLDGVSMNISSVDGTLYITDYDASLYEVEGMTAGTYRLSSSNANVPNANVVAIKNMKGVTFKEELTTAFIDDVKNYYGNLYVGGTFANLNKSIYYSGNSIITMNGSTDAATSARNYQVSKIHVSGDISVGENVYAVFAAGNVTVDSGSTLTAIQSGTRVTLDGAKLTVSGLMKMEGKDGSDLVLTSGTLNAARYVIVDSEAITTVYYTTIDAAIATIDTVEDKTVYAYGSTTSSADFDLKKDQIITFVPFGNTTSVKITVKGTSAVEDGAYTTGTGYFSVSGTLTFYNYYDSYSASDSIVADVVFDRDPVFIFTSLANAVSMPGVEEVVLNQTAEVSKSMTIPEGVTVTSNKYSIIVDKSVVLTVAGQVVLTKGTIFLENPDDDEKYSPGDLVVTGSVIVKYEGTEDAWSTYDSGTKNIGLADVDGAHFTAKYNGITMYYITSVGFAAENVSSGAIEIKGIVISGDADFAYTKGNALTVSVVPYYEYEFDDNEGAYTKVLKDSYLTIVAGSTISLDSATFAMGSSGGKNGIVTGTIEAYSTDGAAAVTFLAAKNVTLDAVQKETSKGTEYYLYISGEQAGTVSIDSGVVTINGDYGAYTTSDATGERFILEDGAILNIVESSGFTAQGDYVTLDGDVVIDGSGAKFIQTGTTVLNGTITVTGKGTLNVGGILQANDGAMIIVDETQAEEGTLTLSSDSSILAIGSAPTSLGAGATVTGPISIGDDAAYVKVYPGSSVDYVLYNGTTDSVIESSFYINGSLYMNVHSIQNIVVKDVIYAETFSLKGLDCGNVILETGLYELDSNEAYLTHWFTDVAMGVADQLAADDKISLTNYEFYAGASAAKVYGTVTVGTGLDLFVDGKNYEPRSYYGQTDYFTVGTHSVYVQYQSGYEGDKVTIKFNGAIVPVTATGGTFTITADMLSFTLVADGAEPYTPEPTPEPEKQSEWTITTILLVILVILIAVMAVIVALRLNRN